MAKIYQDFKEVENEFRENVVPLLYKYRTWEDDFHKKIITEQEVWFAHPFTLNDTYDVRPPYNIINPGINWPEFRNQLVISGRHAVPELDELELQIEVEKRLAEAQADPVAYFTGNRRQYILDEANYNSVGVFSTCKSGLNEAMWAHYGNNHHGFAIGFDSAELAQSLACAYGDVVYDDTPIGYIILGDNSSIMEKEMYQKSKRWAPEEEFRFITLGIGFYRGRSSKFPANAVREILVGASTSDEVINDIRIEANKVFNNIPIFRVERQMDAYGFQKRQL